MLRPLLHLGHFALGTAAAEVPAGNQDSPWMMDEDSSLLFREETPNQGEGIKKADRAWGHGRR